MTEEELTVTQIAQEELEFQGFVSTLTAESLIEDSQTLNQIHALLDGQEWTPDHLSAVADLIETTGRIVKGMDE